MSTQPMRQALNGLLCFMQGNLAVRPP